MILENISVEPFGGKSRITARICDFEVWFELPTVHFQGNVGDAFACLAFFPAMSKAATKPTTLTIPESYSVSPGLKKNLQQQMLIFQAWSEQLRPFNFQAQAEKRSRRILGS